MSVMSRFELLLVTDTSGRLKINHHPIRTIILAVSALIAVTGLLSAWSPGDIVFTIILAVAIALWGYYGFLRIQRLRYRPADVEKWSRVSKPTLWEAACIYDDIEPYFPLGPGSPSYPTLQMLKSEHMNGNLQFDAEDESGWQRVELEELRKLAVRFGHKSKCLFPDTSSTSS